MREKTLMSLTVNGEDYAVLVEPRMTLLELLREELELTGSKEVCDLGTCGACTVLLDGKPALSCVTLAVACAGKQITTVEGLKGGGGLHKLQTAFLAHGAVQCGMCTPGMLLISKVLLDENPHPSEWEVRDAIAGNLCRCTGYEKIVQAVLEASEDPPTAGERP